jgi:hypothetical protein
MASFGEGTLPAALSTGILRGDQPPELPQLSWGIDACQVATFSYRGDRHGELDAAPGLEGFDDGRSTPGLDRLGEFLLETRESLRVFIDRPAIFLEDHVLGRRGTDDLAEPPEVGWAPHGPAGRAKIGAQEKRVEPELGGLEITEGVFTRPSEVAKGVIVHGGDIHRGEIPRAPQAGQWHGVPTVGVHPVARLLGNQ